MIADMVGSRRLPDRAAAQSALEGAVERVEADLPRATRPLRAIVGDELQGVYPALDGALASLLLLRLALPDGIECRFGVGVGEIGEVPSAEGGIAEGPGWWAARQAIDLVHALQARALPSARTWVVADEAETPATHEAVRLANAYLVARDHLVGGMGERARRLTYGRCMGRTQRELAAAEKISQSAVSQAMSASGGTAIVHGLAALLGDR